MNYTLTFNRKETYLYVRLEGKPSYEDILTFWEQVRDEASKQDCLRTLIDARLDSDFPSFSTAHNYSISARLSELGFAQGTKVAIVYAVSRFYTNDQFGETVARNRGFNIRIFKKIEEAEDWLNES